MSKIKNLFWYAIGKLSTKIPKKHKMELTTEMLRDNLSRLSGASVLVFIFELFMYFVQEAYFQSGYVIVIFLLTNLVLIPLIWILKSRVRRSTIRLAFVVQYGYCLSVLLLGLLLALVVQSQYDLIHMYLMAVIGIAAFVNMKPLRCLILLGSVYAAFWFLLPLFQSDPVIVLTNRMNALMFNILALLINYALIKAKYTAFLNRKALDNKNEMLRDLARKDSMTGLLNHAESLTALNAEIRRASRYATPLSLILMDIDDFKEINDRYGHLCGDEVIRKVAATIRGTARDTDIVGRYGGEEFVIILPGVPLSGACALAVRLSSGIQAIEIEEMRVTVSGGVSQYQGEALEALIRSTDERLYKAKSAGKNHFVSY